MAIEEKLKQIRVERGYSQETMAHRIGVSYVTYHNMEKGKSSIKFSVIEKCAEVLGVPLLKLLPENYINDYQMFVRKTENRKGNQSS